MFVHNCALPSLPTTSYNKLQEKEQLHQDETKRALTVLFSLPPSYTADLLPYINSDEGQTF